MKHKNIHQHITHGIIALFLILISQQSYSQYGYPPPMRISPYPPVVVRVPHPQSYGQPYNPYVHTQPYNNYVRTGGNQPYISFGIHFDPLISWFSTYSYNRYNDGAVPGFNFGISHDRYFSPNYSFSSGINIINAGGRLISNEITQIELKNYDRVIFAVQPGQAIIYHITYLTVPLGLKLRTNQMGYGRFFTDIGFDPKFLIRGRADIPSLNIIGGNALPELNPFNISFHIMAGMEYPLSGSNNLVFGIGFDNSLFDITRNNGYTSDAVYQKSVSFRFGITF